MWRHTDMPQIKRGIFVELVGKTTESIDLDSRTEFRSTQHGRFKEVPIMMLPWGNHTLEDSHNFALYRLGAVVVNLKENSRLKSLPDTLLIVKRKLGSRTATWQAAHSRNLRMGLYY
jgi:hypothetical protein